MFKLNRFLLKKGFKSLFKTKIFSFLIMLLIFISGATYTTLSSSTNAFSSSLDSVNKEGKLQQYVVKENFQFTDQEINNSQLNIGIADNNTIYSLPKQDDPNLASKLVEIQEHSRPINDVWNPSRQGFVFSLVIDTTQNKKPTGIYQNMANENLQEIFTIESKSNTFTIGEFNILLNHINGIKSNITSKIRQELSDTFVQKVLRDYGDSLYAKSIKSLGITKNNEAYKVVRYQDKVASPLDGSGQTLHDAEVNKMVIYDGTKYFTPDVSDQEFAKILQSLKSGGSDEVISKYKVFKQSLVNPITGGISITDPNAFQAIVSPAYANKNGKQAISVNHLRKIFIEDPRWMDDTSKTFDEKIAAHNISQENVIMVGNTPYFIIGIGTTPDFSYPIISSQNPIVDANTQAIVYVSNRGYLRIFDAFRTNPQENYTAIRFKNGVSMEEQTKILQTIEARTYHTAKQITLSNGDVIKNDYPKSFFPKPIRLITTYDHKGDQLLLTQERSTALQQVNRTVKTLTYTTTTLLIIFIISIIAMIYKVIISGNRKVYATMHALGYSKFQIAISNALVGIVLTGIPNLIAYGTGYLLQFLFIGTFANLWTIPAYATSFSWVALVYVIVFPMIIVSLIIFIVSFVELRYKITNMLSNSVERTGISAAIISKFKFLGAKTKYVFAISLKNLGKLSLIAISSIIALCSIMVGIGALGAANKAYSATSSLTNYEFAIDLSTPTQEGGQYGGLYPHQSQKTPSLPGVDEERSDQVDLDGQTSLEHFRKIARWHLPSVNDAKYTESSFAIFDRTIDWSEPANELILGKAAIFLKNLLQSKVVFKLNELMGIDTAGIDPWKIAEKLMPENQRNQANEGYEEMLQTIPETAPQRELKIQAAFTKLLNSSSTMPFIISYNQVILDNDDERYTHVDANVTSKNDQVVIRGINPQTSMVNISSDVLNKIDNFSESTTQDDNGQVSVQPVLPVVINKYLQKIWDVDVGSYLKIDVTNSFSRYQSNSKIVARTMKVLAIADSYNDSGIYTTRRQANSTLGLDQTNGFNGVFSRSKQPSVLRTLPLYSESGIYIASDSFTGKWDNFLKNYLASPLWKNESVKTVEQFISKYSSTPFVSLISNVKWRQIDHATFKNITDLSATIINIIEIISISLSIILTTIIAALMFKANRKKIAALWTLGYRKKEINWMFMSVYIVPILIGLFVATLLSFSILLALEQLIINFGHVLIPLSITWWNPIAAFIPIAAIFIIVTTITIYSQKQTIALEAFKGD